METPPFHITSDVSKGAFMCLYQIKLRNPKYQINEKNLGNVPIPKDKRHLYILTDCGWCEECRKKIANNWRIRLQEEWTFRKNWTADKPQFLTLSFSPEAITELEKEIKRTSYKGLGEGEIDVNDLAAFAIRRWSERWRKETKYAPYKWLITELGHKGTERLHLHGILWTDDITRIGRTWKYGNIYVGKYVNERTFNYITKYITKIDNFHKGYKQRIFASKGIGKAYIYSTRGREHKFDFERTVTYYRNHQGIKFGLPKYYKEKLWTEEQREWIWSYILDQNQLKIAGTTLDRTKYTTEEIRKILQSARETNERAGFGNATTCNKKYIITDCMKMTYKEFINYNKTKLVKAVDKRFTEKIVHSTENEYKINIINGEVKKELKDEIKDKSLGVDRRIYGEYFGNLTDAQRKYNNELRSAKEEKLSVRRWRLKQKGLPY